MSEEAASKVLDSSSQAKEVRQGSQDSAEILDSFFQASKIALESADSSEILESMKQATESIINLGTAQPASGSKENSNQMGESSRNNEMPSANEEERN